MALSTEKRTAAALEAAGKSTKEIAEIVDRSPATVNGWKKDDAYLKELDKQGANASKMLMPLILTARQEAIEGGRKAIETLVKALEANTKDGKPSWGVRVAAAQTLVGQPFRTGIGGGGSGDGGSDGEGSNAQTAVIVVQGSPDAKVPDDVKAKAHAVIDAPAKEV